MANPRMQAMLALSFLRLPGLKLEPRLSRARQETRDKTDRRYDSQWQWRARYYSRVACKYRYRAEGIKTRSTRGSESEAIGASGTRAGAGRNLESPRGRRLHA